MVNMVNMNFRIEHDLLKLTWNCSYQSSCRVRDREKNEKNNRLPAWPSSMLPMVHPSKWPLQWFPQVIVGKVLTIKDLRTSWMMHSWGELQYPKDGLFRNSQSSSWGIIIICLEFQDSVGFCLQRWYRYAAICLKIHHFSNSQSYWWHPNSPIGNQLVADSAPSRPSQKPSLLWNRGINGFGSTSCDHFFFGCSDLMIKKDQSRRAALVKRRLPAVP